MNSMKESDISESDHMTENDGESTEIDESTNEDKVANADDDWLDVEKMPEIFDFNGSEGLERNLSPDITPFEAFSLIFNNVLVEKIVNWTNYKAKVQRSKRKYMWKDTDAHEIKKILSSVYHDG